MTVVDANRYWRRLRALRANPPGVAGTDSVRRNLFNAALEQTEQLTQSAAKLGPETSPINLFYGISQGTRAIAAALEADNARFWLSNHGIDCPGNLDRAISNIEVCQTDRDRGAFSTLVALLESPGLPNPTPLGQLLAALPVDLPASSWSGLPRAIFVEHIPQGLVMTRRVFARSSRWPVLAGAVDVPLEESRTILKEYIESHYPSLADVQPRPDGHAGLLVGKQGMVFSFEYELDEAVGGDGIRARSLVARSEEVQGHRLILPVFGGASAPCHPTVVCWAVLWTLSMLARYAPVRWAKALDVKSSSDAIALEEVLQDFLHLIPWCIVEALDAIPDWSEV